MEITSFQLTTNTVDHYICVHYPMDETGGWTVTVPDHTKPSTPTDLSELFHYARMKSVETIRIHADCDFIDELPDWRELEEAVCD